ARDAARDRADRLQPPERTVRRRRLRVEQLEHDPRPTEARARPALAHVDEFPRAVDLRAARLARALSNRRELSVATARRPAAPARFLHARLGRPSHTPRE